MKMNRNHADGSGVTQASSLCVRRASSLPKLRIETHRTVSPFDGLEARETHRLEAWCYGEARPRQLHNYG
jgi:hypothetical protein